MATIVCGTWLAAQRNIAALRGDVAQPETFTRSPSHHLSFMHTQESRIFLLAPPDPQWEFLEIGGAVGWVAMAADGGTYSTTLIGRLEWVTTTSFRSWEKRHTYRAESRTEHRKRAIQRSGNAGRPFRLRPLFETLSSNHTNPATVPASELEGPFGGEEKNEPG